MKFKVKSLIRRRLLEVWTLCRMFPRRNLKIVLILILFCTFLLIYSCLSLITTKGVVVFNTNKDNKGNRNSQQNANLFQQQQALGLESYQQDQLESQVAAAVGVGGAAPAIVESQRASSQQDYYALNQQQRPEDNLLRQPDVIQKKFPDTLFREDLPRDGRRNIFIGDAVGKSDVASASNNNEHQQQSGLHPREIFIQQQRELHLANNNLQHQHPPSTASLLKIPYKLVHIDLKGAPPKLSYLKSVFEIVKANGGNGILLEYEDMFPFETNGLNGTSHLFHYSHEDITDLISKAKSLDLDIIPLVQTFGHLEFILKLERFRHLREVDDYPQEICPSNEVAWNLVTALIDQVIKVHKDAEYIHIGCDEVFHIGECNRCKGKDTKVLFLNHVKRVATYIYEKYKKRSIIWDDMLRKFYVEELIASDIGNHVEIMIWDYTEDIDRLVAPYLWTMYGQVFPNIWIASAFKGAFGETMYSVHVHRHALNHLSWLRVLNREQSRIKNLRGFVITGWSRYDHFAVLCELLPVAIPSLILTLQILVKQNMDDASKAMYKYLKCDETNGNLFKLDECVWDGSELYNSMRSLHFYEEQSKLLIHQHREEKGWLSPYNIKYNYTSPWRLLDPLQIATQYLASIKSYEFSLQLSLRNFYDEHVVEEWLEQKLSPIVASLEQLIKDCQDLSAKKSWDRRPVKIERVKEEL